MSTFAVYTRILQKVDLSYQDFLYIPATYVGMKFLPATLFFRKSSTRHVSSWMCVTSSLPPVAGLMTVLPETSLPAVMDQALEQLVGLSSTLSSVVADPDTKVQLAFPVALRSYDLNHLLERPSQIPEELSERIRTLIDAQYKTRGAAL